MYPHERSLVEAYRNRPFALVGVNSDQDRATVQQAIQRHGLNWRSWFAGGPEGEIPRQWGVTSWPTFFLIDAQGVVRHRATSLHGLDGVIEALVREAEMMK